MTAAEVGSGARQYSDDGVYRSFDPNGCLPKEVRETLGDKWRKVSEETRKAKAAKIKERILFRIEAVASQEGERVAHWDNANDPLPDELVSWLKSEGISVSKVPLCSSIVKISW